MRGSTYERVCGLKPLLMCLGGWVNRVVRYDLEAGQMGALDKNL